jgi:hypothetical protein
LAPRWACRASQPGSGSAECLRDSAARESDGLAEGGVERAGLGRGGGKLGRARSRQFRAAPPEAARRRELLTSTQVSSVVGPDSVRIEFVVAADAAVCNVITLHLLSLS